MNPVFNILGPTAPDSNHKVWLARNENGSGFRVIVEDPTGKRFEPFYVDPVGMDAVIVSEDVQLLGLSPAFAHNTKDKPRSLYSQSIMTDVRVGKCPS
jgi:hypothetical protein